MGNARRSKQLRREASSGTHRPRSGRRQEAARSRGGRHLPWWTVWGGGAAIFVALILVVTYLLPGGGTVSGAGVGVPVGHPAPGSTISLRSTAGSSLSLSELRGHKVVVFFYEGATCGACQQQLIALNQAYPQIRALGGTLVAVSVDTLVTSQGLASQLHLHFPVLQDTGHLLGSAFGVFNLSGGMSMGPVDRHSIFVLNPNGTVHWEQLSLVSMSIPVSSVISAVRSA